jgi:hypothetical protein
MYEWLKLIKQTRKAVVEGASEAASSFRALTQTAFRVKGTIAGLAR